MTEQTGNNKPNEAEGLAFPLSGNEKLIEEARRLPDQYRVVQLSETQYLEDQALAELDAVGYQAVHTASRLADALEAAEEALTPTDADEVISEREALERVLLTSFDYADIDPSVRELADAILAAGFHRSMASDSSVETWVCGKCGGDAYEHSLTTSTCIWEPIETRPAPQCEPSSEDAKPSADGFCTCNGSNSGGRMRDCGIASHRAEAFAQRGQSEPQGSEPAECGATPDEWLDHAECYPCKLPKGHSGDHEANTMSAWSEPQGEPSDAQESIRVASPDTWGWDACMVCGSKDVTDRGMMVLFSAKDGVYVSRVAWCDQSQECRDDLRQVRATPGTTPPTKGAPVNAHATTRRRGIDGDRYPLHR